MGPDKGITLSLCSIYFDGHAHLPISKGQERVVPRAPCVHIATTVCSKPGSRASEFDAIGCKARGGGGGGGGVLRPLLPHCPCKLLAGTQALEMYEVVGVYVQQQISCKGGLCSYEACTCRQNGCGFIGNGQVRSGVQCAQVGC